MIFLQDNEHFKNFAVVLENHIAKYGKIEDWYAHQKGQVETLIALEKKWRTLVTRHQFGLSVYRKFVRFIAEGKRNILAARPYFRERQEVFAKYISKALKKGPDGAKDLYRFAINYQFILFAMKQKKWTKRILKLAEEIRVLRQTIVEMNMPLAINRARVFYSRTPHSHLSYMDLIQIAAEGLMSGIDKYSPAKGGVEAKVFRSTAMGRMGGNFIEEYCVDPETKVLTTDLRWVCAGSLKVNDVLVGFDESLPRSGRRKWRKSKVLRAGFRELPKRSILMDNGEDLTVSNEHLFLCVGGKGARWGESLRARSESPEQKGRGHRWVRADNLVAGDQILFLVQPWSEGRSFDHGYLKGIADGEGWLTTDSLLGIAQKPGVVFDEIGTSLRGLGFHPYAGKLQKTGIKTWCVGGVAEVLRFLGEVRPSRLLKKSERAYLGKSIARGTKLDKGKNKTFATVVENSAIGIGPVVTLKTSTGTLITDGFLSHNSETLVHFYPIDKRKIYRANKLVGRYAQGVDYEHLADAVNTAVKKDGEEEAPEAEDTGHNTTATEIADLMAAASTVSADSSLPTDPEAPEPITRFAAPESSRPDVQFEATEVNKALADAESRLTIWEKKLLRLKGIRIDELGVGA